MGFPDYGVDADQLKTLKPFDADAKKSAGPQPKHTSTASGDMLKALVADTASAIAPLRGDIDHQFASANRIVSAAAEHIAGRIPAVKAALVSNPGDVGQIGDLLHQFEKQLQILFVVARRHKISLQGAHLDALFDAEDGLRQAAGESPLYRADAYYDDAAIGDATANKQTQDPTSDSLNSGEKTSEKPQNRKQLIKEIESFGFMVSNAMRSGLQAARDVISEPDKPKSPELLEVILDGVLDFAINAATGMAGKLIKDMMKAAPKISLGAKEGGKEGEGGEEDADLGHAMIETLSESLKDAGKGMIKPTIAYGHAPKEEEGKEGKEKEPDKKLGAKAMYFQAAETKTSSRMDATIANYSQAAAGRLLRMPVPVLQNLAGSFTEDLKTRIKEETTNQLVDGWVVFGKQAFGQGQYAGDPSKRPSGSVLDAPVGICEIFLTANGPDADHLEFKGAHLPYQTDAVLANIQQQKGSLADLAIERSIRVGGVAIQPFYVTETGQIDKDAIKNLTTDELVAYANIANAGDRKGDLESSAMAGMYKILHALNKVPRSKITEGWS